ncbi:hypothetical protein TNCV_1256631 [Trichonephila clavipes]|nr:hypothetical protein TNCV_1256631 [Trichonephila clavipes]
MPESDEDLNVEDILQTPEITHSERLKTKGCRNRPAIFQTTKCTDEGLTIPLSFSSVQGISHSPKVAMVALWLW